MGYNLASTAACSSARHARVGSRKRKIADVDAALTLLSIEKMQPPRTDEQTDYHTVTLGEQAVVPAIEQAVEQVIDDRTHAQDSQTDVTAEDISYLEEDNRARVAESSEPTFSIYTIVDVTWVHQRRPASTHVCPVSRSWMLCSNLSSNT